MRAWRERKKNEMRKRDLLKVKGMQTKKGIWEGVWRIGKRG